MSFAPRPVDQLSPEELTREAKLARLASAQKAKIKAAYDEGRRAGVEQSEGMLTAAAIAQRADHDKEVDRVARLWKSNAIHMGQARLAIGALLGCITGMALGWLAHDIGLDRAFEAASDATARGALIGSVQRAAEGNEP